MISGDMSNQIIELNELPLKLTSPIRVDDEGYCSEVPRCMSTNLDKEFLKRRTGIGLGFLTLLIGFVYYPTLLWLFKEWSTDKAYSHGYLIPPVAIFIVWKKREQLRRISSKPSMIWGALVLLAGAGLELVGRAGAFVQVEAVSLLIILPGIVLFVLGWGYLKALALPLFYLQFMVPWMDDLIGRIHLPFQILSAEIGAYLLKAFGYSVFHDGIYIHLPGIIMEVAEACSGVQFLTSVVAIGIPLVYLSQTSWRRAAVVLSAGVVITVLSNSLRVALAGMMGQKFGVDLLHGPSHVFQGWFVAWIGWIGLFFVNWALGKQPSDSPIKLFENWKNNPLPAIGVPHCRASSGALAIVFLFLAGLGVCSNFFGIPQPVLLQKTLSSFPQQIGPWRGNDSGWIQSTNFFPAVDAELTRTYDGNPRKRVNLYIAYLDQQTQDERLISFKVSPLYRESRKLAIETGNKDKIYVTHSFPLIEGIRYEMVFWYILPSGEYAGRYWAKFRTLLDSLFYRRNNAAVVILSRPANPTLETSPQISEDLLSFFHDASPVLRSYLAI